MSERYYVLEITTTSNGAETRNITPYTDFETALRKFFAPLGSIGAGPKKICVNLLDSDTNVLKKEIWTNNAPEDEPSEE